MLKAAGIHRKFVSSARLIEICRTYIYSLADYAVHLMPLDTSGSCPLSRQLELLDYRVVEYALGCIAKDPLHHPQRRIRGRLPRHLKIAKLPDWLQRVRMRLYSLAKRLRERSRRERQDPLTRSDSASLAIVRATYNSPRPMTKNDVPHFWIGLCRSLRRRIPIPDSGYLPILYESDPKVRDAGIRWLCGTFPGNPALLEDALGSARYNQHKSRITSGMQAQVWSSRTRRETVASLLAFVEVLDTETQRRKKRRPDSTAGCSRVTKLRRLSP